MAKIRNKNQYNVFISSYRFYDNGLVKAFSKQKTEICPLSLERSNLVFGCSNSGL